MVAVAQLVVFAVLVLGGEPLLLAASEGGAPWADSLVVLTNPLLLALCWLGWNVAAGRPVLPSRLLSGWRLAIGLGVLFFALRLANAVFIEDLYQPILLDLFGGDPDAHGDRYAHLHGDLGATLRWIGLIWLFAAVGEELFFRGLMLERLRDVIGGRPALWSPSC